MELIIGMLSVVMYLALVMVASFAEMQDSIRLLIIILSTVFVFIVCFILLRTEQVTGYYEYAKCGHRYVPTYSSVLWAMHINRTRYMRCPHCNQKSWKKKVIRKD